MQAFFLTLVVVTNLLFQPVTSSEPLANNICSPVQTLNSTIKYANNQTQSFISENEFYNVLDKAVYEEYSNSTLNIRQKILFKDVSNAEFTFNQKTNLTSEKLDLSKDTFIDPHRQVYFLASYYQSEQEEFHKFLVIDAETKAILFGRDHYRQFDHL